jgi:HD-like signal output (HDOD) protein
MSTIATETERKLASAVERMPAFPKSVQRILELTRDINCAPKELVSVIEKDPVMTVKILQVINSAYYNMPSRIHSVGQSVVYLGLNTIKNLALTFAAVGMLPRFSAEGFDMQEYLLHSLTTAGIARQFASSYAKGETDPGDCYITGLLHDFGKAVFAQFMPEEFGRALNESAHNCIPLHVAETEILGADHAFVGGLLVAKLKFPDPMVECIRNHHSPNFPANAMMDCVRVANQVSRKLSLGQSGSRWIDTESVAAPARFGDSFDQIIENLGDIEKIVADARTFAQLGANG